MMKMMIYLCANFYIKSVEPFDCEVKSEHICIFRKLINISGYLYDNRSYYRHLNVISSNEYDNISYIIAFKIKIAFET